VTPVVCTLLQLIAGAPYAVNERAADATPALRTALRGRSPSGFDPRFLLALPITLG
jgi:hypothetical protein